MDDKNVAVETLQCNVSTANTYRKSGYVSTIVRSYKSVVTKHIKKIDPDFA